MPTFNKRQIELLWLAEHKGSVWPYLLMDSRNPRRKEERRGRHWSGKTAMSDLVCLEDQGLLKTDPETGRRPPTSEGSYWAHIARPVRCANQQVGICLPPDKRCITMKIVRVMPGDKLPEITVTTQAGAPPLNGQLPEGTELRNMPVVGTLFVTPGSARIYYGSLSP